MRSSALPGNSQVLHEHARVLGRKSGDFRFDFAAYGGNSDVAHGRLFLQPELLDDMRDFGRVLGSHVDDQHDRLCRKKGKSPDALPSSDVNSSSRRGFSFSRASLNRRRTSFSISSSGYFVFFKSLARRSSRFSIAARSEKIISSSKIPISLEGPTLPSTCGRLASSKSADHMQQRIDVFQAGKIRRHFFGLACGRGFAVSARSPGRSTYSIVA